MTIRSLPAGLLGPGGQPGQQILHLREGDVVLSRRTDDSNMESEN